MQDILEQCREQGLRITIGLRTILNVLSKARQPQSLLDLEQNEELNKVCDRATIFRTLQRLENAGLLRRLNFAKSGAKFSLNTGFGHKEYLICSECGEVRELDISCPVHSLQEKIAQDTGYTKMTHELVFYGLCSKCSPA